MLSQARPKLRPTRCLDHVVVFGETHLRQILRAYADYYNRARTHVALRKTPPSPALCRRLDQSWPSPFSAGSITNTPGWLNW
jgi:hypothetical protein